MWKQVIEVFDNVTLLTCILCQVDTVVSLLFCNKFVCIRISDFASISWVTCLKWVSHPHFETNDKFDDWKVGTMHGVVIERTYHQKFLRIT